MEDEPDRVHPPNVRGLEQHAQQPDREKKKRERKMNGEW